MEEKKGERRGREGGEKGIKFNNISYYIATSVVKRSFGGELVSHLKSRQHGEKGRALMKSLKYKFCGVEMFRW